MELKKLMGHISIIPDYRQAWKVEHKLSDILLLTICAVISGAEGWEDIEDFGETHLDFLKQYGDFENGIPVHDTIARVVSYHWHVENKLHWRLDVVMNEDDCKIRRGNAAELFSGIRHIAINILTNDKVFKAGLRRKMRKAAMDRNYLASVLAGSGLS
ncbi:transposase [Escherichia coli]|uniref:transposase family protein n=1 Tax=Escherichia coli TaxID=562 RepID=UPI001C70816A|nr:transposase family protein [Escherichia coli]MBW9500062.1 transposase [Escherichia coli]